MKSGTLSGVMTRTVVSAASTDSIKSVAGKMQASKIGSVPILDDGKLVGVVTDRDIVLRCVANGKDINGPVEQIMTRSVVSCTSETTIAKAAGIMGEKQIRRLYVLDGGKVAGVVALGDLAQEAKPEAGDALEKISGSSRADVKA